MNQNEIICNLKELLKDATRHLDYSVRRDGTPDEVYMRDVVSLTAAIQALVTQGAAKPEQPKSREGELLGKTLAVIADTAHGSERLTFEAVAQMWQSGGRVKSPLERAAAETQRVKWGWATAPENLGANKNKVLARVGLLLLDDLQRSSDEAERKE